MYTGVVVTRPLPRDIGMVGDRRVLETDQCLNQRGIEKKSPKSERHRVRNCTLQNEMRSVLDQMTAGAA